MNLQIASSCYLKHNFNGPPAGTATRRLDYNALTILKNVQVSCLQYENNVRQCWGFLTDAQKTFFCNVRNDGYVAILGMLLPVLHNTGTDGRGRPWVDIFVGNGDGTGEDFEGDIGADIRFTFFDQPQGHPPTPYSGPTTQAEYIKFVENYMLGIDDPMFGSWPAANQSVKISVDVDKNNKKMIEAMLLIHFFDKNGTLLGIMDTKDNNSFYIDNYNQNGLFMLPLIAGKTNPKNPRNGYLFEIGDPKRDADIEIDET